MQKRPTLASVVSGPSRAPNVFLLHGFLGSGRDWTPLIRGLGDAFRCHALDLPGHGASVGLPASAFAFEAATRAVVERLVASAAPSSLVGYSMGGRVALAAAVRAPERVRSLVIVSASPGLESGAAQEARTRDDDRLADRLMAEGTRRFLETWYEQQLFDSLVARPALRRLLIDRRSAGDAAELAQALRGLSVGRQTPLWKELPRLRCPVLFVAGERDGRYSALLARAAGLCPQGRLLIVPGAGHMPHLEHPAFTHAQVGAFLRQHAR